MGLTGCYTCIKYLMVFINIILWLLGFGVVLLSIWMLTDPTLYVSITQDPQNYYIALYVMLGVGVLWLIVGFLGCCGAFRESQCMLISFFSFLLVLLVAEIAAAVWCYSNCPDLEVQVRKSVKLTVLEEYPENRKLTLDTLQSQLQCCGADGPQDWSESKFTGNKMVSLTVSTPAKDYKVPKSCCIKNIADYECETATKTLKVGATISNYIYAQGCTNKLMEALKQYMMIAAGVSIGIVALELIGIIFSLVLCIAISRSDRYKA